MNSLDDEIKAGDEIIVKNDNKYDVLTVLRVSKNYVECFEYDPKKALIFIKEDVEKI